MYAHAAIMVDAIKVDIWPTLPPLSADVLRSTFFVHDQVICLTR